MVDPSRIRIAALAIALAALGGAAEAKTERTTRYTFDQVWPTAVRHLRLSEGFAIVEKDVEVGYVVFELKEEGKVFAGSLEVVRGVEPGGRPSVRLVLRIGERPAYMEAGVLDRMLAKLREDYGDPPPPPPAPAAPPRDKARKKRPAG